MRTRARAVGLALRGHSSGPCEVGWVLGGHSPIPEHRRPGGEGGCARREKEGKAAFRKPGSEWFHGTTYLFAYDFKANGLLNPAFPAREGTNVAGQKDSSGKAFHDEMIRTAQTRGSGWVDYSFPKPGQTKPSKKWSYVKRIQVDGVPGLIASGFYPE